MASRRVLFVAPEIPDDVTRRTLELRGFALTFANESEGAYQHLRNTDFSLVIVDLAAHRPLATAISRGSAPAIKLIQRLRETEHTKTMPVLVLGEWGTGGPSLALSRGADAYERTPIQAERLVTSIERLLTEHAVAAGQTE